MHLEANYIIGAMAIGIGATLTMDLWNLFLKRAFNIPSLNYCLLGRWLSHMPGSCDPPQPRLQGAAASGIIIAK